MNSQLFPTNFHQYFPDSNQFLATSNQSTRNPSKFPPIPSNISPIPTSFQPFSTTSYQFKELSQSFLQFFSNFSPIPTHSHHFLPIFNYSHQFPAIFLSCPTNSDRFPSISTIWCKIAENWWEMEKCERASSLCAIPGPCSLLFLLGTIQGKYQKDGVLGYIGDDYILKPLGGRHETSFIIENTTTKISQGTRNILLFLILYLNR